MNFKILHDELVSMGYGGVTADAKIAHDVVLNAIEKSKLKDHLDR